LVQYVGADTFRDVAFSLLNDGSEASTIHELQEDPEPLPVIESVETSDNIIVVIAHLHYAQLIFNDLPLFVIFRLNKLQGILFIVILSLDEENSSETTVSNFLYDFIVFRGVLL
jgi:hypothetical protein